MRYPEIDIIKGIAVILMVIYHYFIVSFLIGNPVVDLNNPYIHSLAVISHSTFILMVGINLYNSYKKDKKKFYKKQFFRAMKLLFYGLLMTLVTYYLYPDSFIRYGIFHFIASALIVSMLFIHNKLLINYAIIFFIVISILSTTYSNTFRALCLNTKNFCFNLGLFNFYNSLDHFSFIPYFVYVLVGIKVGQILYSKQKSPFIVPNNKLTNTLALTGKYSLQIYLVHWFILYFLATVQGKV